MSAKRGVTDPDFSCEPEAKRQQISPCLVSMNYANKQELPLNLMDTSAEEYSMMAYLNPDHPSTSHSVLQAETAVMQVQPEAEVYDLSKGLPLNNPIEVNRPEEMHQVVSHEGNGNAGNMEEMADLVIEEEESSQNVGLNLVIGEYEDNDVVPRDVGLNLVINEQPGFNESVENLEDGDDKENCPGNILRMRSNSVLCDTDSDTVHAQSSSSASLSSSTTSLTSTASEVEDIEDNAKHGEAASHDSNIKNNTLINGGNSEGDVEEQPSTSKAALLLMRKGEGGEVGNLSSEEVKRARLIYSYSSKNRGSSRSCPLPALDWANAEAVWQTMCKKDEVAATFRDCKMLDRHPSLNGRMRAILLDWMIEVCEVYKLHRETYYLAVDFLDRYLTSNKNVQKTHLQLIGITCLFVAAKVEEIYPPKISDFAYVTDGACCDADILRHEILLLQSLHWNISPITAISWLGVYMQLNVNNRTPESFAPKKSSQTVDSADNNEDADTKVDNAFIYPQFSGFEFAQTAQLLDLCSLDVGFSSYSYSVLAAAAMSHTFNRDVATRCSGLTWKCIEKCAHWMEPFFTVISNDAPNVILMEQSDEINSKCGLGHICPNIVTDDAHILQTHNISMDLFDRGNIYREQALPVNMVPEASPASGSMDNDGILTPPTSGRKPTNGTEETMTTTQSTVHHEYNTENCENNGNHESKQ